MTKANGKKFCRTFSLRTQPKGTKQKKSKGPKKLFLHPTETMIFEMVAPFLTWKEQALSMCVEKALYRCIENQWSDEVTPEQCVTHQIPAGVVRNLKTGDPKQCVQFPNATTLAYCSYVRLPAVPSHLVNLHFNEYAWSLERGVLPDTLEALSLGRLFNHKLEPGHLPPNLTFLHLGFSFNRSLMPGVLPQSLLKLNCGHSFNRSLAKDVLPESLQELRCGRMYNKHFLAGCLPVSLHTLELGFHFKQQILEDELPWDLRCLRLGFQFDFCLEPLPSSLTELHCGHDFNEPFAKHVLPCGLLKLHCGYKYNKPFAKKCLPHTLTNLHCGHDYDKPFARNCLPRSLEFLHCGFEFTHELKPGDLPSCLTVLNCGPKFLHAFESGALPNALTSLTLAKTYSADLDKLATLSHLHRLDFEARISLKKVFFSLHFLTLQKMLDHDFVLRNTLFGYGFHFLVLWTRSNKVHRTCQHAFNELKVAIFFDFSESARLRTYVE
jgi:hypothetical protein